MFLRLQDDHLNPPERAWREILPSGWTCPLWVRWFYDTAVAEARAECKDHEHLDWIQFRYGYLPDFKDAKIPSWIETPMTQEILEEWWQIVSPRDFQIKALGALRVMWEGSYAGFWVTRLIRRRGEPAFQ